MENFQKLLYKLDVYFFSFISLHIKRRDIVKYLKQEKFNDNEKKKKKKRREKKQKKFYTGIHMYIHIHLVITTRLKISFYSAYGTYSVIERFA